MGDYIMSTREKVYDAAFSATRKGVATRKDGKPSYVEVIAKLNQATIEEVVEALQFMVLTPSTECPYLAILEDAVQTTLEKLKATLIANNIVTEKEYKAFTSFVQSRVLGSFLDTSTYSDYSFMKFKDTFDQPATEKKASAPAVKVTYV
jgi:hypothetical protein